MIRITKAATTTIMIMCDVLVSYDFFLFCNKLYLFANLMINVMPTMILVIIQILKSKMTKYINDSNNKHRQIMILIEYGRLTRLLT